MKTSSTILVTASGAIALALLLSACTSNATESHASKPHATHSAEATPTILPGYHYKDTPVFQLSPLPESDKQYADMQLAQYISIPQKERATGYGAYLAQNVYKYNARHAFVSGDKGEIISAPLTLQSPASDIVNFTITIDRLGLDFQSTDKATPTVLDEDEADKLYASFYAISPNNDNAAYDINVANAKTSKFTDVDYAALFGVDSGSPVITNEGTRSTITDADGNEVVELQGVQWHGNIANATNYIGTFLLYEGTDPTTNTPAVYPVFVSQTTVSQ